MTPAYPVAEQECDLSKDWSFRLPGKFRQRVEEGSLIFWRPSLTIYAVVWNNDKKESAAERLSWIKENVSAEAFDAEELQDGGVVRFSYRLTEDRGQGTVHALYGYAIGHNGHVQFAAYFDRETDIEVARNIWLSITEHPNTQAQRVSAAERDALP